MSAVPTLPQSKPTGSGAGSASLSLNGRKIDFAVVCSRGSAGVRATGNAGSSALTLTVTGKPLSAVLVTYQTGKTVIYQALSGLRDDAGKAEGKITVTGSDTEFRGSGTFVITQLDAKGKRVKLTKDTSRNGTFTLTCGHGYAKVTAPAKAKASAQTSPTTQSS